MSHQLGADTFLLLGTVQPIANCVTSVVLMLIYKAAIIVLLLEVATQLQMLAGKFRKHGLEGLVELLNHAIRLWSSRRGPCLVDFKDTARMRLAIRRLP